MIFQKIKASLTIEAVVKFYGVKFTRGKAICPLHGEKTPSFVVYNKNQTWQCMGCKQGGDIINFVSKLFGLKNIDAVKKLDYDFKLGLIGEKPSKEELLRFKQQQEAREHEREQQKLKEEKYFRLWEVFAEYDKIRIANMPENKNERPNDLLIHVCEMVDIYWEQILNYKGVT
jgi:DNA primase